MMDCENNILQTADEKIGWESLAPVDTDQVATEVLNWLTDNKIHHTVFARSILGWNTAFTPLLRRPVVWQQADERIRRAYQSMADWLRQSHQERLASVRDKQEQMNRKRRNEHTGRDRTYKQQRRADDEPPPETAEVSTTPPPALHCFQQQPPPPPSYHDTLRSLGERPVVYGGLLPGYEELSQDCLQPVFGAAPAVVAPQSAVLVDQCGVTPQPPLHDGAVQASAPHAFMAPLGAPPSDGCTTPFATALTAEQHDALTPEPLPAAVSSPELEAEQLQRSPASSGESRRTRVLLTSLQRRALVDIFHVTARPSQVIRQQIADVLGLPMKTVSNFFSTARTRGIGGRTPPVQHGMAAGLTP